MVKRAWMAIGIMAMQLFAAPQQPPVASIAAGELRIALPDHILERPDVRRQMATALTTTFIVDARIRQQPRAPRSRIEIRFDLWDAVYLVRRFEKGRLTDQRRIATLAELRQWWRTPIHVSSGAGRRATVDLQLIVLPFSAAEEGDARDWLEKSGGVGTDPSAAAGIVGAMIGTTIQARPIATLRWTIDTAEESR